jgi:HEAT repeat protein
MGLLEFFFGNKSAVSGTGQRPKSDREWQRLEKIVSTKLSQNLDRQEALEQLAAAGTARAATILLKRFNWSMDPSITDQDEKQIALDGLIAAGESALEPIREYCRRAESLTWPLKALRQIVAEESFGEELLGLLDQFDTEYMRNPEPKTQLLTILEEHRGDEVRVAVEPFLEDAAEPVRFTTVGTLFAVGLVESVPALIAALEQEESLRIRNRIAEGLAEVGWTVPEELRDACSRGLPPGFSMRGGQVTSAR